MACRVDSNAILPVLELLIKDGESSLCEVLKQLYNKAMLLERERHLKAEPYERTEERQGYANGFKNKQLKTRVGKLNLSVPQVRDGDFYPGCLERGCRSERAFLLALAEMYIQGVSTRKVKPIIEELCGFNVSSSDVSRACQKLDGELSAWRNRPLGAMTYLYLDARYEKVRQGGHVVDCAVLIASGVDAKGYRHLLGVSVSLSEQEVHWRQFLEGLVNRGLHGMRLLISDAHSGLKAAKQAVFPSIPWQRCQFHLQQNAQSHVPSKSMKQPVANKIRSIFDAENKEEAERLLDRAVKAYEETAPKLAEWMAENIGEGLTVFNFPQSHWKKIRTNNMLERVNREIKRRTRVATLFPNDASCLRLVTAVIMDISDEWETGYCYLNMEDID